MKFDIPKAAIQKEDGSVWCVCTAQNKEGVQGNPKKLADYIIGNNWEAQFTCSRCKRVVCIAGDIAIVTIDDNQQNPYMDEDSQFNKIG